MRAYLFAAVASAAVGRARAAGARSRAPTLLTESDRARALFQDPNVFGPFLIPAALILVEEILDPRLLRARLVTKALLIAIVLLGVLFSYSRGAWLNLGDRARRAWPPSVALRGRARGARSPSSPSR